MLLPPPYEATRSYRDYPTESEAAAHDARWAVARPKGWKTVSWPNLNLRFESHAGGTGAKWKVWMGLRVMNIPHLMRHGLHWSRADILAEKGFMTFHGSDPELTSEHKKAGWLHTRTFFLECHEGIDDEGGWFGRIKVYAKDTATLASFKLADMSLDTMSSCEALNWDRQIVYAYESTMPGKAFNAIYDDMPLQGWWPWPKESGMGSEGNHKGGDGQF